MRVERAGEGTELDQLRVLEVLEARGEAAGGVGRDPAASDSGLYVGETSSARVRRLDIQSFDVLAVYNDADEGRRLYRRYL